MRHYIFSTLRLYCPLAVQGHILHILCSLRRIFPFGVSKGKRAVWAVRFVSGCCGESSRRKLSIRAGRLLSWSVEQQVRRQRSRPLPLLLTSLLQCDLLLGTLTCLVTRLCRLSLALGRELPRRASRRFSAALLL
jgi:hypothetical protein